MRDLKYPSVSAVDYSEDEVKYRGYLIDRLEMSKASREKNYTEFDEMSYTDYFESNAKAGNSYIRPKNNAEDVRVVTGKTKEKVDAFVSALLNYNFEPNVRAYDAENREFAKVASAFEALIYKSRELELPDYETKKPLYYREATVQGTAIIEDAMIEITEIEKELIGTDWTGASQMKKTWKEKPNPKITKILNSNLISGLNFFPGNIHDFFMHSQPFVFTREIITYEQAGSMFSGWKRFANVGALVNRLTSHIATGNVKYNDWSLEEHEEGFVEYIKYFDKPNNEFQIILNGVMMLPVGFPLSALTGVCEYPIVKLDIQPIGRHFFYSRSLVADCKTDQSLLDEFYRMSIVKTRKSIKPPMANNTRKHLTDRIFESGRITDDIDPTKLSEIGTNQGVTSSEFNMLQFIQDVIDKKSVSPVFEGNSPSGAQTATEIVELKKQSIQKLGGVIWGVINFEESLAWLRLMLILEYWTKTEDTKVDESRGTLKAMYKRFEVEDDMGDGQSGTRMIEFTEDMLPEEQLSAKARLYKKRQKRNVKITQLKPSELRNAKLNWQITITPTERDKDALDKAMFIDSIARGKQLFPNAGWNDQYLQEQYAIKAGLDPEKAFISPEEQQQKQEQMMAMMQQQQMQGGMQGQQRQAGQAQRAGVSGQAQQAVRGRQARAGSQMKPSLNRLANA